MSTQVVVVDQPQTGFFPMMIVCGFACLAYQYFWYVALILILVSVALYVAMRFRAEHVRQQILIANAHRQDRLFLAGDPHGIYGDFDEIQGQYLGPPQGRAESSQWADEVSAAARAAAAPTQRARVVELDCAEVPGWGRGGYRA